MDYLQSAQKSLFRFERLQVYDMPEEQTAFQNFCQTGVLKITGSDKEWFAFLQEKHGQGVVTQRVRLIEYPLTDYTRFELAFHRVALQHGDDIRFVTKELLNGLSLPVKDFWLIDDKIILIQNYDTAGRWLGFEVGEQDMAVYQQGKNVLLEKAQPLDLLRE